MFDWNPSDFMLCLCYSHVTFRHDFQGRIQYCMHGLQWIDYASNQILRIKIYCSILICIKVREEIMVSKVKTATVSGISAEMIEVEADVAPGIPSFDLTGNLGTIAKEARERVRTALRNSDVYLNPARYTINLAPQKDEVSFDDFGKMDIRTATVLEAERVPKTDKLLKLTIDTGIDQRTIVSGIAEYYSPEDMLGKQICILANLAPRKIRGIESKGMILMARQGDGKMRFITPAEALVNGAEIG